MKIGDVEKLKEIGGQACKVDLGLGICISS
jgi:hypothetical protein